MKRLKVILSFLTVLLFSNNCLAQNEFDKFSTDIFMFINKLNNQIDTFFVKEKAQSLNRNLGYFKNDLDRYLKIRKSLLDYLNKTDYKTPDKGRVKQTVSDLKNRLEKLGKRLNQIRPDVSENLASDAEDIIEKIFQAQQVQRALFLTELDRLINGEKVDVEKLKKEGVNIYNELLKSVTLIGTVRTKLKTKFNLTYMGTNTNAQQPVLGK